MENQEHFKIHRLTMENIKKVIAIDIVPTGNMVILKGKNASGKTSAMDGISWVMEGKAKIGDCPIRYGQNKAWIEIDFGNFVARRTFKLKEDESYDTVITVTSKDGSEFKSPQTLLDTFYGFLSFDPLNFKNADTKEQVTMLEALVKDFDFGKSRADEEAAYNERTIVNRKAKDSSLVHVSFKDVPVPEPEKVDVAALTERLANASKRNVEIEAQRTKQNQEYKTNVVDKLEAVEKMLREGVAAADADTLKYEEAKKVWEKATKDFEESKKAYEALLMVVDKIKKEVEIYTATPQLVIPELEKVDTITAELSAAQAKNDLHERWLKRNKAKKEIEDFEKESEALTTKIGDIQKARFNAVAGAGLPVSGLGFNATGVTLNDLPFANASDAEQLRASIAIAMAANPILKVIRVRDGSLLDDDGMTLLAEMAEKADCQVWVERVGSGGVGFEMVDGSLKQ